MSARFVRIVCACWLLVGALTAQNADQPRSSAKAREEWRRLSHEERTELLKRYEAYQRLSPAEHERLRSRAEVLARHRRRMLENLRAFAPTKIEALRSLPIEERRTAIRRLLEQHIEGDVVSLRDRLGEEQWKEVRSLRAGERGPAIALRLREATNASEHRVIARWGREGVLEPDTASQLTELPWEERGYALRRTWRRSMEKRMQAQAERRPELFPEEVWKHSSELDDHALFSAWRVSQGRLQASQAGLEEALPPFLIPGPSERRRIANLPFEERRSAMREAIWKRFEVWAARHGASATELERWRGMDVTAALDEFQKAREKNRHHAPRGRRRG